MEALGLGDTGAALQDGHHIPVDAVMSAEMAAVAREDVEREIEKAAAQEEVRVAAGTGGDAAQEHSGQAPGELGAAYQRVLGLGRGMPARSMPIPVVSRGWSDGVEEPTEGWRELSGLGILEQRLGREVVREAAQKAGAVGGDGRPRSAQMDAVQGSSQQMDLEWQVGMPGDRPTQGGLAWGS